MKVLLTGGTGILGTYLALTKPADADFTLTTRRKKVIPKNWRVSVRSLEITDLKACLNLVSELRPDVIIHAASMGNVDECERNPKLAQEVNVGGTEHVLRAAESVGAHFMYPSTNAVFDGKQPPYDEAARPNPLNVYGQTKAAGESIARRGRVPWLIIRLMTLYGWTLPGARPNPATWLLPRLERGERVKLVDDRFFNPPYGLDVANALWQIVRLRGRGVYHLAGPERTDRYHWGKLTAEVFGFDADLLEPAPSSAFPELAPRPVDVTYSYDRAAKEFGYAPRGLREGLTHMREDSLER